MSRSLARCLPCFTIVLLAIVIRIDGQTGPAKCPAPFPAAKFYVEHQPDSPIVIRDLTATHVRNPNDLAFKSIRVTHYFENRSSKKVESFAWDSPMPDDDGLGGGANIQTLLPGESLRSTGTYHTMKGPTVVLRMISVKFADGTEWKARRYQKAAVLRATPICVTDEIWPKPRAQRSLPAREWANPVFADRKPKIIPAGTESIEGVTIDVEVHQIKRERLDELEACPLDESLDRLVGKRAGLDYDVERYKRYSVNGKTFAYLVNYELVDERGQFEIGIGTSTFYVDAEGDGKFSLQCDAGNGTPQLPAWVKKLVTR